MLAAVQRCRGYEGHRPRLRRRLGLEGLPPDGRRSAGIELPPACASPIGCRRRSSRPPPRPKSGTTRTSASDAMVELVGGPMARTGSETSPCGSTSAARGCREGRHPARRHQVSNLAPPSTTGELILIDEIVTPDSSRFWDASDFDPTSPGQLRTSSSSATGLEPSPGTRPSRTRAPGRHRAGTRERYVARSSGSPGPASRRHLQRT